MIPLTDEVDVEAHSINVLLHCSRSKPNNKPVILGSQNSSSLRAVNSFKPLKFGLLNGFGGNIPIPSMSSIS